ncbi:30S ribosomal protein S1, partial [Pseudomonas amygdali pv. mori str. 301020]
RAPEATQPAYQRCATLNLQAGSIITAIIVDIDYQAGWVTVHAG